MSNLDSEGQPATRRTSSQRRSDDSTSHIRLEDNSETQPGELGQVPVYLDASKQWQQVIDKVLNVQNHTRKNKVAGRGLIFLGIVVLIMTLLLKFAALEDTLRGDRLETPEFITPLVLGTILMVIGAFLQAYTFKVQADERKGLAESAESLLRHSAELQANLLKAFIDAKYNRGETSNRPSRDSTTPESSSSKPPAQEQLQSNQGEHSQGLR